jgi:Fe-S-cluster containining protein
MKKVINAYAKFLDMTSEQFKAATHKNKVGCKSGCHECCSVGFFDITLLDAIYVRDRLKSVPAHIRDRVVAKANEQLDVLEKKEAFSRKDPVLRSLKAIDKVSRRSAKVRCPALDDNGACLIYECRPHICRIFGPTIRGKRRAVQLEGCGYFKHDIPEADFPIISHYQEEDVILRAMFKKAGRTRMREIDTIIPAALTLDLKKWL